MGALAGSPWRLGKAGDDWVIEAWPGHLRVLRSADRLARLRTQEKKRWADAKIAIHVGPRISRRRV